MENILDKISHTFQELTPSQRKVAQYVYHNINEVFLLNSFQIAKTANVSEATVTRFLTNLGFSGFSEFKREIARQVLESFSTTQRLAESAEDLKARGNVFSEILQGDIENIQTLTATISDRLFEQAVNELCSARSIYVLGLRSSYALAFYLTFDLRFFLDRVILIKPGIGDMPEQVLGVAKDDVLVVISFRRYTRESFDIAEKIKKRAGSVIALTNSELSPVAKLADVTLVASTNIPTYIESYTAPMSLINALITAIALRKKDQAISALNRLETTLEEFQTYIS
ncbi:MAG: MurR/RpiR family transcriptional regulator [Deltaproteobacteria bacterium]|nr:MAG: MurR/RpiR family transcriptional regulator [Deltaproteobacteria bacterium]